MKIARTCPGLACLAFVWTAVLFFRPPLDAAAPTTPAGQARYPSLSRRSAIESEIRMRAARYMADKELTVDYYRIGRRLAFPLGFEKIPQPALPVPGIPDYPWEIWMAWQLEERLNSLGWAAQWFKDEAAAAKAGRELEAISGWPDFTPNGRLDLCLGHTARILCQAYSRWDWLSPQTREAVGTALDRLVSRAMPWVEAKYGKVNSASDVLESPDPQSQVHNIPFIGLVGVALAANTRGDSAASLLNDKTGILLESLMNLRQHGYSEAVAYDGYLLDFISCWIRTLPTGAKQSILARHDFSTFLNESYILGAPGEMALVAEIADVEPRRMPFHISAQANLQQLRPDPLRAWYLSQCRGLFMRADALACLHELNEGLPAEASFPSRGVLDAHYATVLRSGWAQDEMAVAVATSSSPAGHIHFDYGSVTIGAFGRWLIADPGYQQYMPGDERDFTLGTAAHNAPVLNGQAQQAKAGKVVSHEEEDGDTYKLNLDMTRCYAPEAGASLVARTIWLRGRNLAVIADQVEGPGIKTVAYHWHGDPGAAWRIEPGWALLYNRPAATLWIGSPSLPISESGLDRMPGSRGQMTLSTQGSAVPVIWWVFSLGETKPALETAPGGRSVTVAGRRFSIGARLLFHQFERERPIMLRAKKLVKE